jgi:hypothetical protein
MNSIDEDWESFLKNDNSNNIEQYEINAINGSNNIEEERDDCLNNRSNVEFEDTQTPKCSSIYISTKTKIAYLNTAIDINNVFWDLPILNYFDAKEGIVKKQMKVTTHSIEETEKIEDKIKATSNLKTNLLSHVNSCKPHQHNNSGVHYKHIQKISVGISKKDITSYRIKEKGAFFNCFALILRVFYEGEFKEMHVKVFNTGKLEIPGIRSEILLYKILSNLCIVLENIIKSPITYMKDTIDNVLINSNFNCGYFINREKLFNMLKHKYKLITMYDPCSYPGIQTKFYFNKCKEIQDGICNCMVACNKKNNNDKINKDNKCKEISFMIFRTGSILIVGNCDEGILNEIYLFIVKILENEFCEINEGLLSKEPKKKVIKKVKKITVLFE